ncbi:MAG: hypothetical protein KY444_11125 [Gemmatimonadetes bacterium]|nr:hypothetical protein [Gemmatimonadota bacterium]
MAEPDATRRLWRIFPWNPLAQPGEAFSVQSVAPRELQGGGRFDLPALTSVLYLGTSAAHGYAEVLRRFPLQKLTDDYLIGAAGHRLAKVTVDLPASLFDSLPDLSDGAVLDRYGIRADTLALPPTRRKETQEAARRVWDEGRPAFAGGPRFTGSGTARACS